jgi:chitin synthase
MFTCFIQYIVLTPTYINVLNIYAFCNTHDISWGTKGDDKAEKLPVANIKPGGKVDVLIPQDEGDLDAQYDTELNKFAKKAPKEVRVVSEAEKHEDYYKGFRSMVVLAWIFCNGALAAVVLNAAGLQRVEVNSNSSQRATIYLGVVLWSVAGLSLFRFIGAMWFLVVRLVSFDPARRCNRPVLTTCVVSRGMIISTMLSSCCYESACAKGGLWRFWRIRTIPGHQ